MEGGDKKKLGLKEGRLLRNVGRTHGKGGGKKITKG